MNKICPDCGAALPEYTDCQGIFDCFLAKEFSDPAYGEVHMLTVACFMIQHGRYSDDALAWVAERLRENLDDGVPPAQIRRQVAKLRGQKRRGWRVTRPTCAPRQRKIHWEMTIANVAAQTQDAETYCALVRQWARLTLKDMQQLVQAPVASKL